MSILHPFSAQIVHTWYCCLAVTSILSRNGPYFLMRLIWILKLTFEWPWPWPWPLLKTANYTLYSHQTSQNQVQCHSSRLYIDLFVTLTFEWPWPCSDLDLDLTLTLTKSLSSPNWTFFWKNTFFPMTQRSRSPWPWPWKMTLTFDNVWFQLIFWPWNSKLSVTLTLELAIVISANCVFKMTNFALKILKIKHLTHKKESIVTLKWPWPWCDLDLVVTLTCFDFELILADLAWI